MSTRERDIGTQRRRLTTIVHGDGGPVLAPYPYRQAARDTWRVIENAGEDEGIGRARTDWREAACPPTRSSASRAVGSPGTAGTVGGAGPRGGAGGTAAHADGPRVVAGGRVRPQVRGGASALGRAARAGPWRAGPRVDGTPVRRV
jgi:hypothetical protein